MLDPLRAELSLSKQTNTTGNKHDIINTVLTLEGFMLSRKNWRRDNQDVYYFFTVQTAVRRNWQAII